MSVTLLKVMIGKDHRRRKKTHSFVRAFKCSGEEKKHGKQRTKKINDKTIKHILYLSVTFWRHFVCAHSGFFFIVRMAQFNPNRMYTQQFNWNGSHHSEISKRTGWSDSYAVRDASGNSLQAIHIFPFGYLRSRFYDLIFYDFITHKSACVWNILYTHQQAWGRESYNTVTQWIFSFFAVVVLIHCVAVRVPRSISRCLTSARLDRH